MRIWVGVVVVLGLAACKKDPGAWRVDDVTETGQISLSRTDTGTHLTLSGVAWPPSPLPTGSAAAAEVKRLAGSGVIKVVWETKGAWSGPGKLTVGGVDVAEALIAAGLARATSDAAQPLRDAEARARTSKLGAWGDAGQKEILRWLRGRALALEIIGLDVDLSAWRDTAWTLAATYEAKELAFFGVSPGDDFGPPPCVDQLATAIRPRLHAPATVEDVTRAFRVGKTLVTVPANGPARCQVWTIDASGDLERSEGGTAYRRSFELAADAPTVTWTSSSEKWSSGGDRDGAGGDAGGGGSSFSSGAGPSTVAAMSGDALVIGGAPWFTSKASCERDLKATFPSGCIEP